MATINFNEHAFVSELEKLFGLLRDEGFIHTWEITRNDRAGVIFARVETTDLRGRRLSHQQAIPVARVESHREPRWLAHRQACEAIYNLFDPERVLGVA